MNGEQFDPALLEEAAAGEPDDEVEVVVRLDEGPPPPGLRIVSQLGPIATGRVRRHELLKVHEAEAVNSLKAAGSFGPPGPPADELAAEAGGPDGEDEFEPEDLLPRHSLRDPARGAGSISAFCDWGPDIAHPDGLLPDGGTRFLAIWDQRGRRGSAPGAGENRFGYGRIHDRDAINRALASGHPYDALGLHPGFAAPDGRGSHGMHTLSIAAGTPGEGRPGGIAPGADLVFVNLADHARGEGATLGNKATLLEAVDFCLEVAAGRPLVCNFSMGRTADAHWGLSLLERAFDALLLAHDGLAFVNSTGNYHRARLHAATRLTPGARYDAGWELQPGRGGPHVLEAWYPWRDTLRFELRAPDGSLLADVPLGQRADVRRDGRLWARVYNRYRDPNAPLNQVAVYVYGDAPAGTWLVSVIGEDVVDGQCDLWIDRTGVAGAQSRFRAEDAVATSTTGSICNGFHPIAVGAFDPHDADRGLAPFSSGGPTGDGRIVPQVVAPGVRIVGARSAPPEPAGEPALLVAKSGTSEAAPFVAGLIACMYEVAGPLPIREVRRLLLQNTEPPPPASRGEEYRWGLGYLDIDAVLAATRRFAQHPPPPGQSAPAAPVEPTPTRPLSATPSAIPVHRANLGKRTPMASDLAMPPIPLETAGEQENIAASTVWTVQDSQAWIRGGPPDFARDGTRTTPRGTRVLVLETQGTYARVATTGHADLGWTALSNLTTYYGRQPDLLSARLAPSQLITIDTSWPNERRELARAYNRLGGLLTLLATQARLEVSAILAVWQVESGGAPHVPGHAIIRFENHLFWRQWGHHDPERFDACFQFGGRPPMTDPSRCDAPFRCHRYRPPATSTDPTPAWRPVHLAGGSQDDEYAALRLAQDLAGDEPALTSISIGGPQILIANHARLGYDSAREMYDAFQVSEAAHLLGFADFCEHDGAGGDTLQRLRDHDWPGFARRYNGTGQVTSYATRLESAYGQASQLFHPERTPATERLEPETDEAPRQTTGQLYPETYEAPPQTTAGDGEPGEALEGRGRDLPDPALTTAILAVGLDRLFSRQDPVVAGQPFDLGEGRTVEVVAAPRGYLTSPAEAGDLLVRQIYGEKPAVTVLDTNRLYDAATAASAAIPSESILPGRYATVRHNGEPRLRRLVDAEDRMPHRQALVRPTRPARGEGTATAVATLATEDAETTGATFVPQFDTMRGRGFAPVALAPGQGSIDAATHRFVEPTATRDTILFSKLSVAGQAADGQEIRILSGLSLLDGGVLVKRDPGDSGKFQVRLLGRVCYPADPGTPGRVAGTTPVPVVAIVHGNHNVWREESGWHRVGTATINEPKKPPRTVPAWEFGTVTEIDSYLGYEYLQRELALNGIASISIDQNITNFLDTYLDTRADMFLATLDEWRHQVETDNHNPCHGKLDFNNVGFIGHSRGGEVVVAAAKKNKTRTVNTNRYGLRAVCSLSPTDFTGSASIGAMAMEPKDAPVIDEEMTYLVVYGALDGDVSGVSEDNRGPFDSFNGTGFRLYDRATCAKAMVFVQGACHNRFNTNWGTESAVITGDRTLLEPAQHWEVAKFYVGGFFRCFLGGEHMLKRRFTGDIKAPGITVAQQWSGGINAARGLGLVRRIDGFEHATNNEFGVARVMPFGRVIRFGDLQVNGVAQAKSIPHQTSIIDANLMVPIPAPDVLVDSLPSPVRQESDWDKFDFLLLRLGRWFRLDATSITGKPPHVRVNLRDAAGKNATVTEAEFFPKNVPGLPFLHMAYIQQQVLNLTLQRLETVRIPLSLFKKRGVDLRTVRSVGISLTQADNTHVFIDSLEIVSIVGL